MAAPSVLSCDNLDILPGIRGLAMSNTSQKRAIKNYRKRLNKRGMARFEVLGLDAEPDLLGPPYALDTLIHEWIHVSVHYRLHLVAPLPPRVIARYPGVDRGGE